MWYLMKYQFGDQDGWTIFGKSYILVNIYKVRLVQKMSLFYIDLEILLHLRIENQ